MDNKTFKEWVRDPNTTSVQISQARAIVDFLEWASEETGRKERYLSEGGYDFRRSVIICGSHNYELVEEDELAELVVRFLKEDQ